MDVTSFAEFFRSRVRDKLEEVKDQLILADHNDKTYTRLQGTYEGLLACYRGVQPIVKEFLEKGRPSPVAAHNPEMASMD